MNEVHRQDLDAQVHTGSHAYVRNLAAAEAAVLRGQFNLAKVLRALAHSQRAQALAAARLLTDAQDPTVALQSTLAELPDADAVPTRVVRDRAQDLAQRALDSLQAHSDVPEGVVAQIVRGCYGCGNLVEGPGEEPCDVCGALASEFEWFEPFYSITPEHLGQRRPAEIVTLLSEVPNVVSAAIADCDDATLGHVPAEGEWCAKEIIAHMLETERLCVL